MIDLDDQMKKFLETKGQDMAQQFQKMQENLANTEVVGLSGIENDDEQIYVKVTLNGLQQAKKVEIGNGAIENGSTVTGDLCKAAFNSALEKLKNVMQKEVMNAYQQVGMPMDRPKDNEDDN